MAVDHAARQGVANGARFFVDFLEHEIGETALFRCVDIPIDMRDFRVCAASFCIEILNDALPALARQLGEHAVLKHDDIARLVDKGNDIASHKRAIRSFAYHDGGVFASAHDNPGLGLAHNGEAVCASKSVRRRLHRREKISVVGLLDKMGYHFGIGLA